MHLHGFYFDVNSRGDGNVGQHVRGWASVPRVRDGAHGTRGARFTMTWVPERAGNWLFHCHDNFHVLRNPAADGSALPAEHLLHVKNHALDMMGGLVMGIEVRGRDAHPVVQAARRRGGSSGWWRSRTPGEATAEPAYGYVLHDGTKSIPASRRCFRDRRSCSSEGSR
jgi:hypothetical protein